MLSVTYQLTEEEYFDYNYFTAWTSPDRKRYRFFYYLKVLALYAVVSGLYIFSNADRQPLIDISVFGIIAIIYFMMVPYLIKRSVRRRVKHILALPENKSILDSCEVILTDTSIIDKDSESETKYTWEAIVKKAETPTSYFLYTNSHHAVVIPKKCLKNEADKRELQRLFDANLPLGSDL